MRDPAQACKNTIVPCEVQELSSERASFQQPGINEEFVKVQPLRPSRIQVDPGNPDHISGFTVVVDPVCLSFMVYEHEYDVHPGREGESERVSCQYRFLSHRLIVKVGIPRSTTWAQVYGSSARPIPPSQSSTTPTNPSTRLFCISTPTRDV